MNNTLDDIISGLLYADGYLAGLRDWLRGPKPEDAEIINTAMQNLNALRVKYEAEVAAPATQTDTGEGE